MRRLVKTAVIRHLLIGASAVMIFPALCFAQYGAIAGAVKDSSGAVLPGVTIEATSPALIEKVRTAVSDSSGQYRLEQLRPGVYTVTFALQGFNSVRREGIEISAGFTAPVNEALRVGAVTETITVTGEAPVVDVQSAAQTKTLGKEALEALPTARSFATLGTTLPGVQANQRDVGGTQGERGNMLSAHGGSTLDMTLQVDGISISNSSPLFGQAASTFSLNDAAVSEIAFETGAISVESSGGGVRVNAIPQEGGNRFSGSLFGNFATRGMSMSNYTDDLKARGLTAPAGYDKLWDESAGFGGPIRRDRVWFFAAHRYRGNDVRGVDAYYEGNPNDFVYDADLSRPVRQGGWDLDDQVRVTVQLSQRNKVSGFFDKISKCNCPTVQVNPTTVGQSSTRLVYPPTYMASGRWQSIISSKLLWDSALAYDRQQSSFKPQEDVDVTSSSPTSVFEQTTGRTLRAPFTTPGTEDVRQYNARGALSYVTGSHAARVGFSLHWGRRANTTDMYSNATQFTLFNGTPQSITMNTSPYTQLIDINSDTGIYASDRWTLRRLTLNAGIRFDHVNVAIPEQSAAASRWIGARSFPAVENVPNWKDVNPRLGVSYDLFGTGKTALKASVNRYVTQAVFGFTANANPFQTTVNSATRGWTDDGDFIPEGDPLNPLPNGEFTGTLSNLNFGKSIVTTRLDPDVSEGWGKRGYNWEYTASVQHELIARVSLEAGYHRRTFHNQTVTDNLDVTPADYDQFCITAPTNPRLGSVSGSQVCGLYDVKLAKAGVASNRLIRFASEYSGETSQAYDGVDLTLNARLTGRLFVQAGFSIGRTVTKNCAEVDSPGTLRFCDVTPPFQGNYRASGGYTFPWQIQVSGVFQSIPPVEILATLPVSGATAAASLGRPLSVPSINVPLIEPSTMFGERVNQLDLRVSKGVRVGRYRAEAIADFYNAFNSSTVLTQTATYGPIWLRPSTILQSAFVKLGGRLTF
jgi:carboxypeptidase family protein